MPKPILTPATGPPATTSRSRMRACRDGRLPAEALSTKDREHLVYELWTAGWLDVEIATHTRMSTYTTVRIRERLGLPARWRYKNTEGVA